MFSLSVIFILIGFIGFFASIFINLTNFNLDPSVSASDNSVFDNSIRFWGLTAVGIILIAVSNGFVSIFSRIYKPSNTLPNRPSRSQQAGYLYFPRIEEIQDRNLRSSLRAAVENLNVENVDMRLFYLGKIFEQELKAFLLAARRVNAFPVSTKDVSKLAYMIDCIERNQIKIIGDKHLLAFLRQERNQRAHGKIPNLHEREKLLQQAPFIAGLYIESIAEIHKKKQSMMQKAR